MTLYDEIMLLVMDCGDWFAGIDANTVKNIDLAPQSSLRPGTDLAELLGKSSPEQPTRERRSLTIFEGNRERTIFVDRLVGIYNVDSARMEGIPPILRKFGVPPWLVGMMWMEEAPVYLLDLFHAHSPAVAGRPA